MSAAEAERLRERLADAEQAYRDLLEGSVQAMMVHRENRLLFVNPAFAYIFGYPDAPSALAVEDWLRFQAPEEVERLEGYRAARLRGDPAPTRYIFQGRRRDGAPIWLENVVRLIRWEGQPAILACMLDVTDRRQMELDLRLSEERFRTAFEGAPVGISVGQLGRGWLRVNDEYCRFLGRSREELLGHPAPMKLIEEISHPDDIGQDLAQYARLLAGEIQSYQMEKRYFRPNGEVRWGQLAVSASRNAEGKVRYIISHIVDITERKTAADALRESEERFRVAFERAPVALALGRYNGQGVQPNTAMMAFLDRPAEWFTSGSDRTQLMHQCVHPEDLPREIAAFQEMRASGRNSFSSVCRYVRPSGEVRWGAGTISVTREPDGRIDYIIIQIADITERKLAEERLLESEERFRIAFEHAPLGIALGMPGKAWIQANRSLADLLGRPVEELTSFPDPATLIQATTHPDDIASSIALMEDLRSGKVASYGHEKRYVRPDGEIRWAHYSAAASRDATGALRYTIGLVADITALKAAQEALQASEERFRIAFEHAPLGIAVAVPEKGWVQMNAAMERFLARPRSQVMGRPDMLGLIREISHPADYEPNEVLFRRMMAGEIPGYHMEKRYILPDGSLRWGFLNVAGARGANGELLYTVTQIADITALKLTELALRDRETTLAAAQRITHLGSWRLEFGAEGESDNTWMEWSDETFRIFGHAPGAFVPTRKILRGFIHPEDAHKVRQAWETALAQKIPYAVEHRIVRPDGTERLVAQQSELFFDEETGKPTLARGTIQDVTEQKELERKLLQSQKLESLGLLAGGIAHDFNNLLTGILGYSSLAQRELSPASRLGEFVSQIEIGARRAAELCQQMLAYAGRGRFEVRPQAINRIVTETLGLLEVSIPKQINLSLALGEGLPPVEVDATQIRQIVMNLITNAADAIGSQPGRIRLTSGRMHCDRAYLAQTFLAPDLAEGEYVFVEVGDTGVGMSPDVMKKIFDPFFTTKFAGRGLGLAAVLGIVRAHHGALHVSSELGVGTTMRLLLPAAAGAADGFAAEAPAQWTGSGLALVIDDENTVRDVAVRMLEALGFTTLSATDGQRGVEAYAAHGHRCSLVLLDLTMPHMDGEQTFRAIRAINSSAQVVLMSGFTEQESLDRFAGTGLAAFLQKPFSLNSLRETLQRVFPQNRPRA